MSDSRRRAKYTQEFKEESVRQVLAGASVASVASSLGIPKASLGNWVRQQERGELGVVATPAKAPAIVSAEQMEIARLRAQVPQLRMERDIAKKAAAYFAQDTLQSTPGFKKGTAAGRSVRCAVCCGFGSQSGSPGTAVGQWPSRVPDINCRPQLPSRS